MMDMETDIIVDMVTESDLNGECTHDGCILIAHI